ncbi:MAG: LytTR family transcriptional regulator DNA-binding domain-containing protein [Marivita sp.]|uniref:MHYT domain-containing protein n=1 Tax=Marivita sp. TaxID=2003365 RepID=UPI0025BB2AE7|nr:MHYT domain-containing protein [Marivita sp.]MCI5112381.1 LytTR family transcriptional regulator DNA-binding domain-containing protein [Marivita sp.]
MEFLEVQYNPWLVAMSLVIALVAGATGLTLTKDLSKKSVTQRKLAVALASVALGGGIWSMHFLAMLGLRMPILFYYDAAITLVSALIAILMVALALVLLHFTRRTKRPIVAAGTLVGLGVLAMHYVGMAGMQLCQPVYTPLGVVASSLLAIVLCVLAFGVAYQARSARNIAIGTLCFGCAVVAVHFLAMAGTNFVALPETVVLGPLISNETLALGVILSSFVIFGTFLWVGSTYLIPSQYEAAPPVAGPLAEAAPDESAPVAGSGLSPEFTSIPCERDGSKVFVSSSEVAFVRADGHYSQVYTLTDRYFCVWPITKAADRLLPAGYMQVHRSYLINPSMVATFERSKDKGRLTFSGSNLPPVPVSRSRLKDAQTAFC